MHDWTLLPQSLTYFFPSYWALVDLIPIYHSSCWCCPGFAFSVYPFYTAEDFVLCYIVFHLPKVFLILFYILGWQSGIQEGAADWDEDWDKFEDEGMQK